MQSAQATAFPLGPSGRRYEPIVQIGRGGMAEVLLTMVHAGGGVRRLEVLKQIWPELTSDPDFVTMFLDEARLSLRLNHANVVQTYEVLSGEGQLAIAMEYLDGQPLTRVLNRLLRGPQALSLPLRLRIVMNVLAGLEHAHTLTDLDGTPLEVVHRDVSPQNVFVTYDGRVKLVDFGVAKTLAASHHTRPGAIKGKLAYMAPEQLQAESVDRRADLFAVGVMLWEMLAARRMWHGKTEVEIVGYLASGRAMPPLPADSNLPPGVDAICMRALDPDPTRRYQTAAELEAELEGVLVGAADSHARNLGKVVSLEFSAERAERQSVIERALRGETVPPVRMTPTTPMPVRLTPTTPPPARLTPGAPAPARLTPVTPVTRVIPAPPAPRSRVARGELTGQPKGIDITVGDFRLEPATGSMKRPNKSQTALRWWRGIALTSLAATSFAAVLLLGGWRRAPATDARSAPTAVVAPAPLRGTAIAETAAAARPAARNMPPAPSRAVVATGGAHDGTEPPRRHRRVRTVDEDATLPPSLVDARP